MASESLTAFVRAMNEVVDLLRADQTPTGGAPRDPSVTKVVGRASVVLLSSHFERYIYAVNEEATGVINIANIRGDALVESLRLVHSASAVEEMVETQWPNRGAQLREFVRSDGWLWSGTLTGSLEHKRLLAWMKAPHPKNLVRYYRYWGVEDIFSAITRAPHTERDLRLKIQELIDKRNNIAHGDANSEATRDDVRGYEAAAIKFCDRADRELSRSLARICGISPW
jgi:RiboL-PSP-HEPN